MNSRVIQLNSILLNLSLFDLLILLMILRDLVILTLLNLIINIFSVNKIELLDSFNLCIGIYNLDIYIFNYVTFFLPYV